MPVNYNVKAAIINESKSNIDRFAARIVQVTSHTGEDYIKTFPLLTDPKNLSHLNSLRQELFSEKKDHFLGISFLSYGIISFVHFTSTLNLFHLDSGDSITFFFDSGDKLAFSFQSPKTADGYAYKNIHPVTDAQLGILQSANLLSWKLTNTQSQSLIGGFTFNEHNKQYKSARTGQKILRLMAENILIAKEQLLSQ